MCLSYKEEFPIRTIGKNKVAYKAFRRGYDGRLRSPFFNRSTIHPVGRWIEDTFRRRLPYGDPDQTPETYRSGFHCLKTHAEARKWANPGEVVRKIYIKDVVETGIQKYLGKNFRVIVARKMYIVPRRRRA